jgi:hypothetical protein
MGVTTVALLATAVLALAGAIGSVWRTFTMGGWHGTSCAVWRYPATDLGEVTGWPGVC